MADSTCAEVAVITATIGHRFLARAVSSVQAQAGITLRHWVVVDGPEFEPAVCASLSGEPTPARELLVLPDRTGTNGYCSHRIYAAMPFLVNAEYVCYLDQDNWYDDDHIASLLRAAREARSPCAYSLRKIRDRGGRLVCEDNCQSLGLLHECVESPGERLIDSSCWLIRRDVAIEVAQHWCEPYVGDRRVARWLMDRYPDVPCTLRYSLNYTAGSRRESASVDDFLRGNALALARYSGRLPWLSSGSDADDRNPTPL